MAESKVEEVFQSPGDILIRQLDIINSKGLVQSLKPFLVELNIYESIFSPTLTGSILLSDTVNLLKNIPVLGEELLVVDIKTPTLSDDFCIKKVFRIYSVGEKVYSDNTDSQLYKLNFCSVELFKDISNNIYSSFNGTPDSIIEKIYVDYLACPRWVNTSDLSEIQVISDLTTINSAQNTIRFTSPGWSPVQCIQWLASKSQYDGACNFLFWETTKGFYFGSTEKIYELRPIIGTYAYTPSYMNTIGFNKDKKKSDSSDGNADDRFLKRLTTIKSLSILKHFDQLSNNMDGYLASRLIDVNLYNKTFENIDYDHRNKFFEYSHTYGNDSFPLFEPTMARNPLGYRKVNYNYPKIYNDTVSNFSEVEKYIFGNRRSNMLELDNFKMKIGIYGRTDIESGTLINIILPKGVPATKQDKENTDELYSGLYLITSLNHKINPMNHFITCELSKDSVPAEYHYGK